MFISKLGCAESRENDSLTSKCRFKNLKIHDPRYDLEVKTSPVAFMFPLSLPDLNKKHTNDIQIDEKQ